MRVLQLIDSLRPGGAEKMAVNIANALLPHIEGSYLCCTRQEGLLYDELKPEVGYLFLNKKSSLDPKAILKLKKFVIENDIDIVHAHSTSYFLAGLLKLSGSRFKLIWHNHFGHSANWKKREFVILKKFSRYFDGIIAVNTNLQKWALKNLDCKNVIEIRNFISIPDAPPVIQVKLRGNEDDFKVICVANLRPEKDHLNLLEAFKMVVQNNKVSLHLVGGDPGTAYSASVLEAIKNFQIKNKIFYYGTQTEIIPLLKKADLGILSSRSEGLPLAIIEYGLAGIPVVCTDVGECKDLLAEKGKVVPSGNSEKLAAAVNFFLEFPEIASANANSLQIEMVEKYSEKNIVAFFSFYAKIKPRL